MKVKFLPKKDIDVQICDIYEDRDAVIIQHTDVLGSGTAYNAEACGFKFNLKPCAFHWKYSGIQDELPEIFSTGVLKFGVYVPTDRYKPSDGLSRVLPDYGDTIITAEGAEYYGKTIGESKPAGYPNNGQELFDYTNGVKGYDVNNGVPGSELNMDFIRQMEDIDNWYLEKFKRLPSSGSDRQGKIGSKEVYMPYYMGIRSTSLGGSYSFENIERLDFIHKRINSRWENGFQNNNIAGANILLSNAINNAFVEKGMMSDFVHWHRTELYPELGGVYLLHDLYEHISNVIGSRNAWSTGFSEAVEYYWFKQMTKRVRGSINENKLYLIADFDDEFINQQIAGIEKKLLYNRIKQPLSVKVDLTGTIFENKDIISNNGKIISLGNNEYIIDIPFIIAENGFKSVVISEATEPNYKNFNKPNVLSFSNGMITTDLPCRAVLYDNDFQTTMTASQRKLELKTTHSFDLDSNSKYIGLITEDGQSILHEL